MMKYLALFVVVASALQLADAAAITSDGFRLQQRTSRVRKLSQANQAPESAEDTDLRQWKEDDYEELMKVMSGQNNLRHRQLQNDKNDYQKKPYYTKQQVTWRRWQKITMATLGTAMVFLAIYICALKKELSSLTQYIPLGYKLFPDTEPEEEERYTDGVQMS